jgi:hypothetical protein
MEIIVILGQASNARTAKVVTPLPNFTSARAQQLENAEIPILKSPFPNSTVVRLVQ